MTDATANNFVSALAEMAKAAEELPHIREELASTVNNLDGATHKIGELQDDVALRDMEIEELKSKLATREAELASATFREAEASTKINNLRAILGTGEPVPVVATDPVGQPQAAASRGEFNADAVGSEPKAQSIDEYVKPPEGPTTTYVGPAGPLSGPDSQATTYGVVEEADRFVSHDPAPEATPELVRPFLDRPHWQKPSSLSWFEWVNGGGEKPYWMTDKDLAVDL